MGEQDLSVGTLVLHPNRPEWGPGKIVKRGAGKVFVVWRDLPDRAAKAIVTSVIQLERAPQQHDAILDNLPPLKDVGGVPTLPADRIPFDLAVKLFLAKFPLGFEDPAYIGDSNHGERHYKWVAHQKCDALLGQGRFRRMLSSDLEQLIDAVLSCERSVNLLSPYEKSAFADAMKVENPTRRYLTALCDLLDAPQISRDEFEPYAKAVSDLPAERGRVATWPVATIIPYLAQPERHMFLKPGVTNTAADALGFNLNYSAQLNWLTYSRLLEMARLYRAKLAVLKPRDMIDVQSFFWVACGDDGEGTK